MLAAGAAMVRLRGVLARRLPGGRKDASPASAKLEAVMSVVGGGAYTDKAKGEGDNDHRTLRMGRWSEGGLRLFGLSCFHCQLAEAIDRFSGCLIIGVATDAGPFILAPRH